MTMHIQKFVDRLRGSESRGQKDFIMTVVEAKDLHADITRLLLQLQDLQELQQKTTIDQSVIKVEVTGGSY